MASHPGSTAVRRVTRDVEPADLRDLLEHPSRGTVAFVERGEVDVLPAGTRWTADRHLFGVMPDRALDLDAREVVLVIDDGPYWFELRGVSVRGVARRLPTGQDARDGLTWYAIEPRRVLAWDYGAIRET